MSYNASTPKTWSLLAVLLSTVALSACGAESMEEGDWEDVDSESAELGSSKAALAGSPYFERYTGSDVTFTAGQSQSIHVYCPSGSLAVGGGARGASSRFKIKSSYRSGTTRWTAVMTNHGTSSSTARAYVNCLMNPGSATVSVTESATKTLSPNTSGGINATCPNGSKLVGGGFATWGGEMTPLQSRRITDATWTAYAKNWETSTSVYLEAYAICLSGLSVTTSEGVGVTYINPSSTAGVWASCASDAFPTSGGFWIGKEGTGISNPAVAVYKSYGSDGSGWYTAARNYNSSGNISISSHSLCTKIN